MRNTTEINRSSNGDPIMTPGRNAPVRKIGRFEIVSRLGEGAMGVVWRAHDPQLDRDVAIKLVNLPDNVPLAQREELTQCLLKEARLAAKLHHPGIVSVHDAGLHEGMPYIIMEFIRGKLLADLLGTPNPLEIEYATELIGNMLKGVGHAHSQGVVHLDLKPANIMIEDGGRVRIMDFGIARSVVELAAGRGPIAGTPRYMAPEQITGGRIDPRADVWALGAIAYEMLAGRRAFEQQDFNALKEAIARLEPPKLHTIREDVPQELIACIKRAMEKKAKGRWSDARRMADAWTEAAQAKPASAKSREPAGGGAQDAIAEYIIDRIRRKGDFPAVSKYIAEVTRRAGSETSSAASVAETILKDYSLTQRLMRLVNSPYYRGGSGPVTTVSRAVVLMGMETVINVAAGLGLFEHFHKHSAVDELKQATIEALLSAMHARRVAQSMQLRDAEECFIGAMLNQLARLIVMFYFPDEYEDIRRLADNGGMSEESACKKIMKIEYSEISRVVTEAWNLPESIRSSMTGLPEGHKGRIVRDADRRKAVVSYAKRLASLTLIRDSAERTLELENLSREFEGKIEIPRRVLEGFIRDTVRNAWDISQELRVDLERMGVAPSILEQAGANVTPAPSCDDTNERMLVDDKDESHLPNVRRNEPTSTFDDEANRLPDEERRAIIMRTLSEISEAIVEEFELNDVLMMVMEGLYRGVGFRHVIMSMLTPKRDALIYRFGLGADIEKIRSSFRVPMGREGRAVALCVEQGKDLVAANLSEDRHRKIIPKSILELLNPTSLLAIPIIVRGSSIGLFIMDRSKDFSELDGETIRNARTLARQAALAITQIVRRR